MSNRAVVLALAGLAASFISLGLPCQSPGTPAVATNVRMQNVIRSFVGETGQEMIGLGSWTSGRKYKDILAGGASDHDLRLLSRSTDRQAALREWQAARSRLTDMIRQEFGRDANKVLSSVNLYPPNQLMGGVEDAADAVSRFKAMNQVPNLAVSGFPSENAAHYTEGLYGPGSQVWTQSYEEASGRLFYKRGNQVFVGMTDLTHLTEGVPTYDIAGMSNTTTQWVEHLGDEMIEGRGDKVAKYLARVDRDLAKAKDLAKLPLDSRWRTEIRSIVAALEKNPRALDQYQGRINGIMTRARQEAAIMSQFARSDGSARALLAETMKDVSGAGRFRRLLDAVGDAMTLERVVQGLVIALQVRQTAIASGEADYERATAAALAGALGIAALPPAVLAEMTSYVMETMRSGGYALAASSQEAWDLMAGIYSAGGRADVDAARGYTLQQLVARIDDEQKLLAVVFAKAQLASSRGMAGAEAGKVDDKVASAIFERCYPVILAAWRAERGRLSAEYGTLAGELAHTPVILTHAPNPATATAGGVVSVTVQARAEDRTYDRKLARMREILTILCRTGVVVDQFWTWSGGRATSVPNDRLFTYDAPGVYPVTATLKVSAGSTRPGAACAAFRRDLKLAGGVDVRVDGPAASKVATGSLKPFEYKFATVVVLVVGDAIENFTGMFHDTPITNQRTTRNLYVNAENVPVVMDGRAFRMEVKEPLTTDKWVPQNEQTTVLTGRFSADFTTIEELTVSLAYDKRTSQTRAQGASFDQQERWSTRWEFGVRNLRHKLDSTIGGKRAIPWRSYGFSSADTPDKRRDFKLVSAVYLETERHEWADERSATGTFVRQRRIDRLTPSEAGAVMDIQFLSQSLK